MSNTTSRREALVAAAIYFVGGVLQRGGQFLLIPLLVATLSPGQFTRYGLFVSAIALLPIASTGNVHSAGPRLAFYQEKAEWGILFDRTLSLALFTCMSSVPLFFLFLTLWDGPTRGEVVFGTVAVIGSVLLTHSLSVARVLSRPKAFGVAITLRTAVVLVGYATLATLGLGGYTAAIGVTAIGWMAGGLLGLNRLNHRRSSAASLLRVFDTIRDIRDEPSEYRGILTFSLPTAINFFAIWLTTQSGRWIGARSMGVDDIADYVLTMIVVAGVGMITRSLFDGDLPRYSERFAKGEWGEGVRVLRSAAGVSVLGVLAAISALALAIEAPMVTSGYRIATPVLMFGLTIGLVDIAYVSGIQVLICLKRTGEQALIGVSGGVATVLLGATLVGPYKEAGLMAATLAGYLILTTGTWWRAFQSRPTVTSSRSLRPDPPKGARDPQKRR